MFNDAKTMRKENKKLAKEKAKTLKSKSKQFLKHTLEQARLGAKKGTCGIGVYLNTNELDAQYIVNKLARKGFCVDFEITENWLEIGW